MPIVPSIFRDDKLDVGKGHYLQTRFRKGEHILLMKEIVVYQR